MEQHLLIMSYLLKKNHCICIPTIDIDSVLKSDKKSISTSLFRTM